MSMRLRTQEKTAAMPRIAPAQSGLLQRKCACGNHAMSGACDECAHKKNELQRRADRRVESFEVPQIVHEVLRSTGRPLDAQTRAFMEPRFGHYFGNVRVHTDARATASAGEVGAIAYTVGRDLVFGDGHFDPTTNEGQSLRRRRPGAIVTGNFQSGIGEG
jgi:hypothetical protein